ncbi:MAG: hypothetical protein JHC28_02585 [Thermoprotei archaeon]|jgi:hypothetical protein|uniref:Uncharacterized protein n=1 Tax=Fervidicoccus fontis TaxID=683846 RepID=A0A7J3SK69_9CREN|nr:hypothetical protein [Thermoprotei archaeon]
MKLKSIYEDEDVVVEVGPHDDEIPGLIMDLFKRKKRPMTWQQLREHFSAVIGEDRLRRALRQLVKEEKLVQLNRTTYADPDTLTPEMIEELEAKRRIYSARARGYLYESMKRNLEANSN